MSINTTPKARRPTATVQHANEAVPRLPSETSVNGPALHRTDPKDGSVTYWAERWGLIRYLPTLYDAGLFLAKIGGRL